MCCTDGASQLKLAASSVLSGHTCQWLPDWKAPLAIPMSLAVLALPTGVDHTGMASWCTWPFSSFRSRFPAVEPQGRVVCETLLTWVLGAHPREAELGGRETSLQKPDQDIGQAEPEPSRRECGDQGSVHRRSRADRRLSTKAPGFQLHAQASTFWAESPLVHWCPKGKGQTIFPAHPSLVSWNGSSFLQGVVFGFCWLFKDMAHCQTILNLLLELSSM